jgi:hypothetical protein
MKQLRGSGVVTPDALNSFRIFKSTLSTAKKYQYYQYHAKLSMCMDRNARCSRTGIEGTRLCHLSELNLLVGRH